MFAPSHNFGCQGVARIPRLTAYCSSATFLICSRFVARLYDLESKSDRFQRIAEQRTNAVIDKLRLLAQVSNTKNYSYSSEQVNTVFRAINKAVREAREQFDQDSPRTRFKF